MPITKATQNVITPNIVTTDTPQTIKAEKNISLNYNGTSSTSLTFALGTQTLTTNTGLDFKPGDGVKIGRFSTLTAALMIGTVTSYNPSTGVLVANITSEDASGTYSSWFITNTSTSAALTITQNGNGDSFKVEDSSNPDSTPFVITNRGYVGIGKTTAGSPLDVVGRIESDSILTNFYETNFASGSGTLHQFGRSDTFLSGVAIYKPFDGYSPLIPNDSFSLDLYQEFSYYPGSCLSQALFGGAGNTGLFIRVFVSTAVIATTISTGVQQVTKGNYVADIVINSFVNGAYTGWTVNGATSFNVTTAAGLAQTVGGVPATGYLGFTATRETSSAMGTINMICRGHTAANTASITYDSYVRPTMQIFVN